MLETTGGSFPLVYLDKEIIEPRRLIAPLIIGESNNLVKNLVTQGQLKLPPDDYHGVIFQVNPEAFNDSSALVILGKKPQYLRATLQYFSRIFPYLEHYQEGSPQITDIVNGWKEFLRGKKGGSEAFCQQIVEKWVSEIKNSPLEMENKRTCNPRKKIHLFSFSSRKNSGANSGFQ